MKGMIINMDKEFSAEWLASKLPIKHPNQKRLEEALEKLKENKKVPKKKKEIVMPSSHRRVGNKKDK